MKNPTLSYVLIALLTLALAVTTYNMLISQEAAGGATVTAANVNIGVYSDSRCTIPVSSINWGNLTQGDTKTFLVYIKNVGTSKVTLSLTTNSWSSTAASQSITVSWDREKTVLSANQIVQATIKLTVSQSSTVASFSFNIVITSTG